MIIWNGWGILVLPIAVATIGIGALLGAAVGSSLIGMAIAAIAAGPALWAIGQKFNRPEQGYHPKTGEPVVYRNRHKLFFVPMQYFAFIVPGFAFYAILMQIMMPSA